MKILFFGDSLTDGGRDRSGEAYPSLQMGTGFPLLINARLGRDYPEKKFQFVNRGVNGNRLSELYARIEPDVVLERPDVISLMAGINDCGFYSLWGLQVDADRFGRLYETMIDELHGFLPNASFLICEPIFYPAGWRKDNKEGIRELLPPIQQAAKRTAEKKGIPFLPLQEKFEALCKAQEPEYWLFDGIHPTPAGHQVIADAWIELFQKEYLQ